MLQDNKIQKEMTPPSITQAMQEAVMHHKAGRFDQAMQLYELVLQNEPHNHIALHAMALLSNCSGSHKKARELVEKAILLNPGIAQYHHTYGFILNTLGQLEDAIAAYQKAVHLNPNFADAHYNMGNVLGRLGDFEAALEQYKKVLNIKHDDAFTHFNMGVTLQKLCRHQKAIEEFQTVVRLGHDPAESYKAMAASSKAMALYDQAITYYRKALTFKPQCPEAHTNLGTTLLQIGNYNEGWSEYSWRLSKVSWIKSYQGVPIWDGSDFHGKHLLIRCEQGNGDNIQFVRYLPMVKARGGKVTLATYSPLLELMKTTPGCDQVVSEKASVLFDLYCPLLELPRIFGTTLESIPSKVPYLFADADKTQKWQEQLSCEQLKVGIVWGAGPLDKKTQVRSCRLKDFIGLADIPNVRLFGLQKGQAAEQLTELSDDIEILNLGDGFNDFADTAAAIENMDLVISVDTSVLHLAGALGKSVWALTLFSPDWRWLTELETNPWYPTMRLFRQSKPGCWDDVFHKVKQELTALAANHNTHRIPKQSHQPPTQNVTIDASELHLKGLREYSAGHYDVAIKFIKCAISIEGNVAQFHNSLGLALEAAGNMHEAIDAYTKAITLKEDYAEAFKNMAIALNAMRQYEQAVLKSKQAIAIKADYAQAYHTLGYAYHMQNQYDKAAASYQKATELKPDFAEAHNHLGVVLAAQDNWDQAIECYRRAIDLEPEYSEAYNNIGVAFREKDQLTEAANYYKLAVKFEPHFAGAWCNLARAIYDQGHFEEAFKYFRHAIKIGPEYYDAHWNLALALLQCGRFTEGWREYTWRRNNNSKTLLYPFRYKHPYWDGSSFEGKRLFVHYEQGLGDTIQFIRYLPMIKARGGTVILEVQKPLAELLKRSFVIDEMIVASSQRVPDNRFDLQASLLDMPAIFETTLETIPAPIPYLYSDSCKSEYWNKRLSGEEFKVGIVWSGSPTHVNDKYRSCKLEHFKSLANLKDIRLYGLQKGKPAMQADLLSNEIDLINLGNEFDDFSDTAAAIENLDLVISVDTSVAHLAGAMGKPVWIILPYEADWRWLHNRNDSPWYPTMQLFKQDKKHCWDQVFEQLLHNLQDLVRKRQLAMSP